jgi:hypothetical protein
MRIAIVSWLWTGIAVLAVAEVALLFVVLGLFVFDPYPPKEKKGRRVVNYPLKDFAEFQEFEGRRVGLLVACPNCGAKGGAWFTNPIEGGPPYGRVCWDRTGETLETLTLTPSFRAVGHYHSWIRNGELSVDSPFECSREVTNA